MKAFFNSALVAFSMFSSFPIPHKRIRWDGQGMKYMMAAFPLIGAVIGALVFMWITAAGRLGFPDPLRALGILLIPVAVTGGIHLDGLADTCDALKANATPERRREILKDPRAGAFAVIGVSVYFIAYLALAVVFDRSAPSVILLCIGYVLTRALSGLAVVTFPSASDGTARMFHDAAARRSVWILLGVIIACLAAVVGLAAFCGLGLPAIFLWTLGTALCFLYLLYTARRKFGGMSGDLAGWFLQLCEIFQLAAIVLSAYI